MEKTRELTKKQLILILIAILALGATLLIYDFIDTNMRFDGQLDRAEAGAGAVMEDLTVEFLDKNEELKVEISDKRLSEKEIKKVYKKAIREIEETYLGQNSDANNVTYDLDLRSSYADGLIEAQWKFDPYGVISSEGKLNQEEIPEEGVVVNLTAILYYEDQENLYSFSVVVNQMGLDTLEGQLAAINREVKAQDLSTRGKSKLALPKTLGDIKLNWKRKMNFRGLQLMILGGVAVLAIQLGKKQDEKKARQKLLDEKIQDYPMIVSQLSILMGAGMSFRKALERIISKYVTGIQHGKNPRAGFEEMVRTYRMINDGRGEIQALEELAKSSESKEYRKLAMMLVQNLRKGSKDLLVALEKEEKNAFEMRKQNAIRAGEEASTKLLVPMTGMLFIVIVILMVPAVMQINI